MPSPKGGKAEGRALAEPRRAPRIEVGSTSGALDGSGSSPSAVALGAAEVEARVEDMTELRQRLRNIAADVLMNPLTSLILQVHLLKARSDLSPGARNAVTMLETNLGRLSAGARFLVATAGDGASAAQPATLPADAAQDWVEPGQRPYAGSRPTPGRIMGDVRFDRSWREWKERASLGPSVPDALHGADERLLVEALASDGAVGEPVERNVLATELANRAARREREAASADVFEVARDVRETVARSMRRVERSRARAYEAHVLAEACGSTRRG